MLKCVKFKFKYVRLCSFLLFSDALRLANTHSPLLIFNLTDSMSHEKLFVWPKLCGLTRIAIAMWNRCLLIWFLIVRWFGIWVAQCVSLSWHFARNTIFLSWTDYEHDYWLLRWLILTTNLLPDNLSGLNFDN